VIRFGPWSTLLGIGVVFGALVAALLLLTRENRIANRLLAALMLVFALKLLPYVLGFAGYYDAYPWLSFAPFDLGLAAGPLLYLHVVRLAAASMPPRWGWHLLPGAAQFLYQALLFALPLPTRDRWNDTVHRHWIDPADTQLELLSFAIYLWLAIRAYRAYQAWLDAHLSNREAFRIPWLRNVLAAFALAWPAWAAYEVLSLAVGFDYFQRIPLYVGFTALVFYLGLEGWRHADTRYPQPTAAPATPPVLDEPPGRDWRAQGEAWLTRIRAEDWWRDPDLGLERLAQHLGTNTAYLSRALNEGLGNSFNEAINGLRVDEVCAQLQSGNPRPLLDLALEAGFNSKTSFNRCFKARTGLTPSRYRAQRGASA
jgi:AraC-like DNA-binding protein